MVRRHAQHQLVKSGLASLPSEGRVGLARGSIGSVPNAFGIGITKKGYPAMAGQKGQGTTKRIKYSIGKKLIHSPRYINVNYRL